MNYIFNLLKLSNDKPNYGPKNPNKYDQRSSAFNEVSIEIFHGYRLEKKTSIRIDTIEKIMLDAVLIDPRNFFVRRLLYGCLRKLEYEALKFQFKSLFLQK
jgi:hypothetical protein